MSYSFTETMPGEPQTTGEALSENQIGHGFYRRFTTPIRDEGHGGYATVVVTFCIEQIGQDLQADTVLTRAEKYVVHRDPDDYAGTATYSNFLTEAEDTRRRSGRTPTEDDARSACAEFSAAGLSWDGWPGSEKPCEPFARPAPGGGTVAHCHAHGTHRYAAIRRDTRALDRFVCDKGRGWVFLIDHGTDAEPEPALIDLDGLNNRVIRMVEARFYGTDDPCEMRMWRYTAPGILTPLTCRREQCDSEWSGYTADNDLGPLWIVQQWEVVDADSDTSAPDASGRIWPPRKYLSTTVTLNGDA